MSDRSQRPPWLGQEGRGWDHVRVHVQLVRDPRLGAHELAVYMGIAVHAELGTGGAWPSKTTLASYAQISERAVYNALAVLEETGYIKVTNRPGRASVYVLLPPPEPPSPRHQVPPSMPTPAPGADHPGTTCRTTPAPRADEREPVKENQERDLPPLRTGGALEALALEFADTGPETSFEEFWQAYPRRNGKRVGKAQARERWAKMTGPERIAARTAAGHYEAGLTQQGLNAMDAERFLRERRWVDWQTPPDPAAARPVNGRAGPPAARDLVMTDRSPTAGGRWRPPGQRP